MELYNHQKKFLAVCPDKKLLCWSAGTGKSRTAIEWAQMKSSNVLIIVPKALRENWRRELSIYLKKDTSLTTRIISKEEFRRDHKTLPKFDALICDESHYFSGQKSQMSKSLRSYIKKHNIPFVLLLTATPYLSTPFNIYTLAGHLGHDWSWINFREKFFYDRYIGRRVIPAVRPHMEKEVAKLVATIGDIVDINECADIPEQLFITEYFKKTKEQDTIIGTIIDLNPIVKFTRHHQVENGTLKSDGYTKDQFWNIDKHTRIIEKCQSIDKVAIVCRYNLQINLLKRDLEKIGKPIFVIRGDTKNRDQVVRDAEAAKECIVLINAACSEGYELPSIGLMLFASMSFSYKDYKQICGRVLRLNKLKKNVYLHLITEGGIDQAVYDSIMNKQDFDISIYERGKISDPIQ